MTLKRIWKFLFILLICSFGNTLFSAGQKAMTGTVRGIVQDYESKAPLLGVNVNVTHTGYGAASDRAGTFLIRNIPVGTYTLEFTYMGYKPVKRTDIVIKSGATQFLEVEMHPVVLQTQGVKVRAAYFSEAQKQAVSTTSLVQEEIRRTAGAGGDISRIVKFLPAVAQLDDQVNSLVVRGGSPFENGFYLDNIELPNINHFPTHGTSGGSMGILNVDLIAEVNFIAGGFPAEYGHKLSSIMEIDYREGNQERIKGQLNVDMAGLGGIIEGPLNEKTNFMLAGRRSYLDLIVDIMGVTAIPSYADFQAKGVYHLNQRNKITLLNILGTDDNHVQEQQAQKSDWPVYGHDQHWENTLGVNWRRLWPRQGYSNTSLAHTYSSFDRNFKEYGTAIQVVNKESKENRFKLRNLNSFRLNPKNRIAFGIETQSMHFNYHNLFGEFTNTMGNTTPELVIETRIHTYYLAGFLSYRFQPNHHWTFRGGLRMNYFEFNGNYNLAPRLSMAYKIGELTTLKVSWGQYYQNLPMILLSQSRAAKALHTPRAIHYIAGLEHLLNAETRLSIEIYHKDYQRFPLDPEQPLLFLIDEEIYRNMFYAHNQIVDQGQAYSQGIELLVQKKMVTDFYGALSCSYFIAKYQDLQGNWRNRSVENRYIFNINGGYKPNRQWEFSLEFLYAGGRPYTPFDIAKSKDLNRGVKKEQQVNQKRYPDYHSLDVRADRRFNFKNANLILYMSIWNAYNHKNVAEYFWNQKKNQKDTEYQWQLTPIFGIEYEF